MWPGRSSPRLSTITSWRQLSMKCRARSRADAVDDLCVERSFHRCEFALSQFEVPGVPVANLHVDEAGGAQAARSRASVAMLYAMPSRRKNSIISGEYSAPPPRSQSLAMNRPPGPQHAQDLREDRRLVGNLHQGVLGEHHIELASANGNGPAVTCTPRIRPDSPARSTRSRMRASSDGSRSIPTTDARRTPQPATRRWRPIRSRRRVPSSLRYRCLRAGAPLPRLRPATKIRRPR